MSPSIDQFDAFFEAVNGCPPFPWQRRLARTVYENGWPGCIDLPTASGKTACIDIAVFVLACQSDRPETSRTIGRRIFYTVNRRVIVDAAFDRAITLAARLRDADAGVLQQVADALRCLSEDGLIPLDVAQLRGGTYRDTSWARSLTQPMVVCTTADQLGSRLLFRGYGVSDSMKPVHAALCACDSLVLLDEAHVTRAFSQTMQVLPRYLNQHAIAPGLRFVQLTATPAGNVGQPFRLDAADLDNPILRQRQLAAKPAALIRLQKRKSIVDETAKRALDAISETRRAVGVIVNRVQTARDVHAAILASLRKSRTEAEVHLVIGRMRPIDRDRLQQELYSRVGPARPDRLDQPLFVVATQCLEVGADYDFDALVTEAASIDALRQRFGRLNRKGRTIETVAAVIASEESLAGDDPIYGEAIKHTWDWLAGDDRGSVDFGIAAFGELWNGVDADTRASMLAPAPDAAVLLPAHLDLLCQTAPRPEPDPDIGYFIHGPQRGNAEVNVCWRADLGDDPTHFPGIVSLLPPTSLECMSVPLWVVARWIKAEPLEPSRDADVPVAAADQSDENGHESQRPRPVVIWRGPDDITVSDERTRLRPGDTVVIRTQDFGWETLGHVPGAPHPDDLNNADPALRGKIEQARDAVDIAELATRQARRRVVVRIHDAFADRAPLRGLRPAALRAALVDRGVIPPGWSESGASVARFERHPYRPDDDDAEDEVITFSRLLDAPVPSLRPVLEDDGSDALCGSDGSVSLDDHTAHVTRRLATSVERLNLGSLQPTLLNAARFHDLGKADTRFQALLAAVTPYEAMERPALLAKSPRRWLSPPEALALRQRALLPAGFRHEMLSSQIVEHHLHQLAGAADPNLDLLLHLIAAHHGYARPFAPVVNDNDGDPELLSIELPALSVSSDDRQAWTPPHRLDSGVPERFWKLVRQFGWWGLPWLEAILRLADHRASAAEEQGANQ